MSTTASGVYTDVDILYKSYIFQSRSFLIKCMTFLKIMFSHVPAGLPWTALALCKSIESAIQWFQNHHRITIKKSGSLPYWCKGKHFSYQYVSRIFNKMGLFP